MSCQLGLWIGDFFAELRGDRLVASPKGSTNSSATTRVRWSLSRKSLGDGIKEALAGLDGGTIRVALARPIRLKRERRAAEPSAAACLVTAGFETWLRANSSFETPSLSWQPSRISPALPEDRIFGIAERTLANGSLRTALGIEELEFLVAKFELLKVKNVAICFVNSKVNPEHEMQAAKFFRERGFRVAVSHSFTNETDERARWSTTIEAAVAEPRIQEVKEQLKTALGLDDDGNPSGENAWRLEFVGNAGTIAWTNADATALNDSESATLKTALPKGLGLYLGLERFYLVDSRSGQTVVDELSLQPTQPLSFGALAFPMAAREELGYEPGPMLFGKSHKPTVIDLLAMRDRLPTPLDGFDGLVSERMRPRINESVLMLGKLVPKNEKEERPRTVDASEIAHDLEAIFLERLAGTLALKGAQGDVVLLGPLAKAFSPLLEKRMPFVSFKVPTDHEWSLSMALASSEAGGKK